MTLFYLIRHGRSIWNALGRWQGQANPPLDAVGRAQAQALAVHLLDHNVSALYSSPLARARETAEAVAAQLGLPVVFDRRLMERDVGMWTGLTGEEVRARWPAHFERDWWADGPPEGETQQQITNRVAAVLTTLVAAHPDETVAVVSHGGTLLTFVRHILQIPPQVQISFSFPNTAITRIKVSPTSVRVLTLSEVPHLHGAAAHVRVTHS